MTGFPQKNTRNVEPESWCHLLERFTITGMRVHWVTVVSDGDLNFARFVHVIYRSAVSLASFPELLNELLMLTSTAAMNERLHS